MNKYWMNKEHGYLLKEYEIWEDAEFNEYDDITDPTSAEYMNITLRYSQTNYCYEQARENRA